MTSENKGLLLLSFRRNNQGTLLPYHGCRMDGLKIKTVKLNCIALGEL